MQTEPKQVAVSFNNYPILRDENGVAHVVGLSGGKDSVCLALALREKEPRPYNYLYTPTEDELPEMENHMQNLQILLGQPIIRATNGTLKSCIDKNNMLPNFRARFCTRLLKIVPAGKFYEIASPTVAYIGLRDDEDEREGTKPGGDSASIETNVTQDFPFQRWGWGVETVLRFLDDRNVVIPERTDCARCPYQTLGEWYNLWKNHRDIYLDAEADEEKYGHTYRSPQRDTWPASLKELRKLFEAGEKPTRSLNMMAKRKNMCRTCSL